MRGARLRTAAVLLAGVWLVGTAGGCIRYSVSSSSSNQGASTGSGGTGYGPQAPAPPDWAPGHGRRYRHPSGVHLDYDARHDVYLVVEYPGMYFHADRFYWESGGTWSVSTSVHGPWTVIPNHSLPPALRKSSRGKKPSGVFPGRSAPRP